jgi:PEP-CTERM motif
LSRSSPILIASPVISWCDTVQFTVAPVNIGTLIQGPVDFDLFSSGLNGTVLAGQSLSLDLVLDSDVLARLFLVDPGTFGIGLDIHTNAGTFPGFAGPTTGYLLDPNGNQFGGTQVAGRAAGDDGTFDVGLVSFTSGNLGGAPVVDISGVHFDTSFPNSGFVITDAQLRFSLNSADDSVEFGTARQLPEPSTSGLILVGALVIALMAWRSRRRHAPKRAGGPEVVCGIMSFR